jgi:hypothetical protein
MGGTHVCFKEAMHHHSQRHLLLLLPILLMLITPPGAVGALALDATGDQTPNPNTYSVYRFGSTGALVPV